MINEERKVIFCHVPKNAGQSVVSALAKAGGYTFPPYPMVEKDVQMTWKDGECRRVLGHVRRELWDECFKFAFVRNPWDRLVSSWEFTRQKKKHDLTFERFLTELPSLDPAQPADALERAISTYWHTLPQSDHLVADGVLAVDFIGRVETLDRDWQEVCSRIGCSVAPLPRRNATVRRAYRGYYDDRTARMAGERFRRDIELFGYVF